MLYYVRAPVKRKCSYFRIGYKLKIQQQPDDQQHPEVVYISPATDGPEYCYYFTDRSGYLKSGFLHESNGPFIKILIDSLCKKLKPNEEIFNTVLQELELIVEPNQFLSSSASWLDSTDHIPEELDSAEYQLLNRLNDIEERLNDKLNNLERRSNNKFNDIDNRLNANGLGNALTCTNNTKLSYDSQPIRQSAGNLYCGRLNHERDVVVRVYTGLTWGTEQLVDFRSKIKKLDDTLIQHRNFFLLYALVEFSDTRLVCIMPKLGYGSLWDLLDKKDESLTAALKHSIVIQTCTALRCLHNHNIIHGRLKASNVLIDADKSAKLTDLSSMMATSDDIDSYKWLSPSQARNECVDPSLAKAPDIYAFGLILWQLITHKKPFHGKDLLVVLELKRRTDGRQHEEIPKGASPLLSTLIGHCWAEPASRFTAEQIGAYLDKRPHPV